MYYLQKKDFVQCPTDMTRILPIFLQPYKLAMHIARHVTPATMATRRRRSSPVVPGAKRPVLRQIQERELEQLPTTDVCTYWPPNPAFDPKRVLLRCMFFINED